MATEILNIVDEDKVTIDTLLLSIANKKNIEINVLRLDKIHPEISGNKWFKLKYFLAEAVEKDNRQVLSFGGAYSNHLIALACAAKKLGIPSIGIIRGERPRKLSPTLQNAEKYGMQQLFTTRENYRIKHEPAFLKDLEKQFPGAIFIPEGGSGNLGVKGSREILS